MNTCLNDLRSDNHEELESGFLCCNPVFTAFDGKLFDAGNAAPSFFVPVYGLNQKAEKVH